VDLIAFEQKLAAIFEMVEDKVVSIDVAVNIVRPGLPFYDRCMQDAYGDPRQGNAKRYEGSSLGRRGSA